MTLKLLGEAAGYVTGSPEMRCSDIGLTWPMFLPNSYQVRFQPTRTLGRNCGQPDALIARPCGSVRAARVRTEPEPPRLESTPRMTLLMLAEAFRSTAEGSSLLVDYGYNIFGTHSR